MEKVITFFRPQNTLTGKIEGLVDLIKWTTDDNASENSTISIMNRIPTRLQRDESPSIYTSVEKLKNEVKIYYTDNLKNIDRKLTRTKEDTKKFSNLKNQKNSISHFIANLDSYIKLDGPYNNGNYHTYQLVLPNLPRDLINIYLSNDFVKNNYANISRQIKLHLNFPFSNLNLEDLTNLKGLSIDFETQGWEQVKFIDDSSSSIEDIQKEILTIVDNKKLKFDKRILDFMNKKDSISTLKTILNQIKNERITVASLVNLNSDENYLITTFNYSRDKINVNLPGLSKNTSIDVLKVKNQFELIDKVNTLIQQINPFYIYGHNIMTFDYRKAQQLTKNFRPGVNGEFPLHISQFDSDFGVQRIAPGRIDIDPSLYAMNYMDCFNNKLDTVFHHLTGIISPKTLNKDDLKNKSDGAEKGNQSDIEEVLFYAAQDSMKAFLNCESIKKELVLLGKAYHSSLSSVCSTSRKSQSENYWVNWHWANKHTYPYINLLSTKAHIPSKKTAVEKNFEDFSYYDLIHEIFLNLTVNHGLHQGTLAAVFPFSVAFNNMLVRDSQLKAISQRIKETESPKERIRLLKALESIAEYPLFRTLDIKLPEKNFAAEFSLGFSATEKQDYNDKIIMNINRILSTVESNLINTAKEYIVVNPSLEKKLKDMEKDNLVVILGNGSFLSGSRGRFAGDINNELFMFGIADFQSNKGYRTEFEKNFYSYFFSKIIKEGNVKEALLYLSEQSKALNENRITQSDLYLDRECKRDHTDYSAVAKQSYIVEMAKQKTIKGDIVEIRKTVEELQSKFFGITPIKNPQSDLFSVHNPSQAQKAKKDGSISTIVDWIIRSDSYEKAYPFLEQIYLGYGSEELVDKIIKSFVINT